jgi:hypothetical protein
MSREQGEMKQVVARGVLASLVLAAAVWSSAAVALDPGNYTVECARPDNARGDAATFDIRMDVVDLLTLKRSFGAVISGVRLDDGRRVILTGDRGCALTELRNASSK